MSAARSLTDEEHDWIGWVAYMAEHLSEADRLTADALVKARDTSGLLTEEQLAEAERLSAIIRAAEEVEFADRQELLRRFAAGEQNVVLPSGLSLTAAGGAVVIHRARDGIPAAFFPEPTTDEAERHH